MAKGSQLSQLKSALSQAGVTKPPQGNKRKRSKNEDVDRDKRAAKLREIQQKMNPFDIQVTKTKHDVGGRRIKGAIGRPAQSKQVGIQQVRASSTFLVVPEINFMLNSVQKLYLKSTRIRIAPEGFWTVGSVKTILP